ncbi:putative non-specific serine/threonine protein kinase [Helianthus anomalus]
MVRLYKEGKALNLIDECLRPTYSASEVLRLVHVGLLCVQQRVEDRPNTPNVVAMLDGEGSLLPKDQPSLFKKVKLLPTQFFLYHHQQLTE